MKLPLCVETPICPEPIHTLRAIPPCAVVPCACERGALEPRANTCHARGASRAAASGSDAVYA